MDKNQLVTIAITAAVSVMAREVANWLFTWAKTRSTSETTKAKLRKIFSKNNLKITWDGVCLAFGIWFFLRTVRDTSPITKWGIVNIFFWTANGVFWFIVSLKDVGTIVLER